MVNYCVHTFVLEVVNAVLRHYEIALLEPVVPIELAHLQTYDHYLFFL